MAHIALAGCIIKNEQGKILLIHRNTAKRTQWEIPGGKIEAGEEPTKTAVREVKEELGIEVSIVQEVGNCTFEEDGNTLHYLWFEAHIAAGTPHIKEPHLHDKLGYFSLDELKAQEANLSPNAKAYIKECGV